MNGHPELYIGDGSGENENTAYGHDTVDSYYISADDADETETGENENRQRILDSERRFIDEIEDETVEHPIDDMDGAGEELPQRKKLKRELREQALKRLEDSARTVKDFENVISWWDRLDANRERRERYHEISRSGDDIPLDYGASGDALCFPDTLCDVTERQIRKGEFLDALFDCPYEIHELVTDGYISKILSELSEEHKFLLFLCALRQYSSVKIAAIRGQTDRNIRKVRSTMFKKIRKHLLSALTEKIQLQQPLTLIEKEFLKDNGVDIEKSADI